ncbi:hypothetical protein [Christiangramia aquimixticola]|uniref:hypothetical protein n=1 Tax=Christiangramia aquimixticola TaxID=1697558 RepID=UPI003AA89DA8
MGKLYFKKSSKEEKLTQPHPRQETVDFLLNYSKALNVSEYKSLKFELLLN